MSADAVAGRTGLIRAEHPTRRTALVPIPGRGVVSFAGLARLAGHKSVYELSDLRPSSTGVGVILAEQGPAFEIPAPRSAKERSTLSVHGLVSDLPLPKRGMSLLLVLRILVRF